MKVDSTKSEQQIPKEKRVSIQSNSETAPSTSNLGTNLSEINKPQKNFAELLNNASGLQDLRFDDKTNTKINEKDKSDDGEKDSKNITKNRKKVTEKNTEESDSRKNSDNKDDTGFGQINVTKQINNADLKIPNARSIIHIADLERIISTIRSQNVANGKQVLIDLKQSIFQGLRLKLTIGKDRSVMAELLAASEQVKTQLNAKTDEIAGLLKERGVKLAKLEMSVSAETGQDEKRQNDQSNSDPQVNRADKSSPHPDTSNDIVKSDTNTSYQV